ncbi:mannitol dehydrogenase family protein [Roseibium sp. HPY-6]|uniref:mannitol dehydrogenase family protein n=1 Tax=Roseibium sp. HPY-6 TaxID=3229852 RepID=UPI0033906963
MSHTPIVQFGTSRFLQAHADLFVSEALKEGRALGSISVVQTSGDPSRSRRLEALASDEGFEVQIKGLEHGQLVDTATRVKSIVRSLSLPDDLDRVRDIVTDQARIILSNTADAGFRPREADKVARYSQEMSYPAKLAWFLFRRYEAHGEPIQVMPTELVAQNGSVLRDLVLNISSLYPAAFRNWLERDVIWVNSLVDRIVSEPLEPAGAVAEPYSLWAIEDQPGLVLPCEHRCIQVVANLQDVETLKLFVLNLGHTYLVSRWLGAGGNEHRYVRDMVSDPPVRADLEELYANEVVPGFGAYGRARVAKDYVATTLDRFKNPFLDHKLADIAQNHPEKVKRRIAGFLAWAREADPKFEAPRLEMAAAAPASVHMLP